ncbi:hypothetical protein ACL02S_19680 [Nocardia sp. 004]|uniref:hypothetical protein n=1 Tax=Nocardia sp. 004 TaxID=3385978 RepID=UPI0039A09BF8
MLALTGLGAALLMLPNAVLPALPTAQPETTYAVDRTTAADPRVADIQRIIEPFGPIVVRAVPTGDGQESLLVGHPSQRDDIDILERELAPAIDAVTEVLGPEWAQSALVVVASSPSEFAGLLRTSTLVPAEVAAASVADPFTPGTEPTGQRVVFSPDAGQRLGPDGMATLLRHELTHLATRARTVDGAPLWMLEGFADYTAHHGRGRRFADIAPTVAAHTHSGDIPHGFPDDTDFSGPDAAFAYEKAWSICAFIAGKYSRAHLVQLYERIAAAEQDAGTEDLILREVLGTTRSDFIAGWRAWLDTRTA